MKTRYLFVVCIAVASALLGQSLGEKQSKMAQLGKAKMAEVTPGDAFEYFSGYLDTEKLPRNFLTIYLHHSGGEEPQFKIIGHNVNVEFPVSKVDDALKVYKGLVLAKLAADRKEFDAIHKHPKTK